MYDYFRGKVVEATPQNIVLEVGGIGYRLWIPLRLHEKMSIGTEKIVYVSFVIKETSHSLYGFLEKQERELFEMLIGLSGIGPKIALSLIGHLSAEQFSHAIHSNNSAYLSKVPGIGKKTAERLIVDLKGKQLCDPAMTGSSVLSSYMHDAVSALMNLGYTQSAAEQAVRKVMKHSQEEADLSQIIRLALSSLTSN